LTKSFCITFQLESVWFKLVVIIIVIIISAAIVNYFKSSQLTTVFHKVWISLYVKEHKWYKVWYNIITMIKRKNFDKSYSLYQFWIGYRKGYSRKRAVRLEYIQQVTLMQQIVKERDLKLWNSLVGTTSHPLQDVLPPRKNRTLRGRSHPYQASCVNIECIPI